MDWPTAVSTIRTRLTTLWPNAGVPLRWENEGDQVPATPAGFVYVEVLAEASTLVSYGGGRGRNNYRDDGAILLHVLVPIGSGVQAALDYAEDGAAIFRGLAFDGIRYGAASIVNLGEQADQGNYWQVLARIEFHFDRVG